MLKRYARMARRLTYFSNAFDRPSDSKNPFVDTRDDLANTSFDTSLLAQISDVLPCFSDDNTSILGANESAESQSVMSGR